MLPPPETFPTKEDILSQIASMPLLQDPRLKKYSLYLQTALDEVISGLNALTGSIHAFNFYTLKPNIVEVRPTVNLTAEDYLFPKPREPRQAFWMRAKGKISSDPLVHQ